MENFIFMYFGYFKGEAKKNISCRSSGILRLVLYLIWRCLLTVWIFLSLLWVLLHQYHSLACLLQRKFEPYVFFGFKGLWSHTHCAYATFSFLGTSCCKMNYIVSVDCTPWMLPCARQSSSIDKLFVQISLSEPFISLSIVWCLPESSYICKWWRVV